MSTYVYIYLAVGLVVTILCITFNGKVWREFTVEDLIMFTLITTLWPVVLIVLSVYGIWQLFTLPDVMSVVLWRRRQ